MRWFRIRFERIEPVEVVRETEKFVVIPDPYRLGKEIRTAKYSSWHESFHSTFQEAKSRLMDTHFQEVKRLEERLNEEKKALIKASLLEEPK